MNKNIFVSSTFKDFQTERTLLQNQVELRLEELLKHQNVSFVDLRWGIDTTEDINLEKVVSICIAEVLNSKPYYIIMLGDNYGNCIDKSVVKSLYLVNNLKYDGKQKSVTEIEIEAMELFEGNRDYVLVLDRHINNSSAILSSEAALLKEKVLSAALPDNIYHYEATEIDNHEIHINDEASLINFVSDKIYNFLKTENYFEGTLCEFLAQEEASNFIGRNELISNLLNYVTKPSDSPFCKIHSTPGAGLTAIMAKLYSQLKNNDEIVSAFYTNLHSGAEHFLPVLKELATQIDINFRYSHQFFHGLNPNRQYIFFVDYLNFDQIPELLKLVTRCCIPDNVTFVIPTDCPSDADFILEPLNHSDAIVILQETLRRYKKELPKDFLEYFETHVPESMLSSPLFLQYFIQSLCYLSIKDYSRLSKSSDFMQELNKLFIDKISSFPKTEEEYIRQCFHNADKETLWILALLSISTYGLDERTAVKILQRAGISCQLYHFYLVKEQFRSGLRRLGNGNYVLAHDSFRTPIQEIFSSRDLCQLRYLYVTFLNETPYHLTKLQGFSEVVAQCIALDDMNLLAKTLDTLLTSDESQRKIGFRLASLCGDYDGVKPSKYYEQLVATGHVNTCQWLISHGMPFLTSLYVQNAEDLLRNIRRVLSIGTNTKNQADIDSLLLQSLVLQFKKKEALLFANELFKNGSPSLLNTRVYLERFRIRCLSYDTDSAESALDNFLYHLDITQPGALSLLCDALISLILLDGNALYLKEQLQPFFQTSYMAIMQNPKDPRSSYIALYIEYLCSTLQLTPPCSYDVLADIYSNTDAACGDLSYQLIKSYMHFLHNNDVESCTLFAALIIYQLECELSYFDYLFLSKFFRKLCNILAKLFDQKFVTDNAFNLFQKLLTKSRIISCELQFTELSHLCFLACLYSTGTEDTSQADLQLKLLCQLAPGKQNELEKELAFFEEDIKNDRPIFSNSTINKVLRHIKRLLT